MSTLPPPLCPVEAIVSNVADGTISHAQGLAQLRSRGYTPWAQVLEDAVHLLTTRDRLIDGQADPHDVLGLEPRLYAGDIRAHAIDKYDADLIWALQQLAKKPAAAGVAS